MRANLLAPLEYQEELDDAYTRELIALEKMNHYHDPKTGKFTSKAGVSLSYLGPSEVTHAGRGMPTPYKTYHPNEGVTGKSPDDVLRQHFKDPGKYSDLHRVADDFVHAHHAQLARSLLANGYDIHKPVQPINPRDLSNRNLVRVGNNIITAARFSADGYHPDFSEWKLQRPGSSVHTRFHKRFLEDAQKRSHTVSLHDSKTNNARYKAMHARVLNLLREVHGMKLTPEEAEARRVQARRDSWQAWENYNRRNQARWDRQSRSGLRRENH